MLTDFLALATACVAVVDWLAVAADRRDIEAGAKPATLLLLLLTAASAGAAEHPAGLWLLFALLLGVIGDVALLDDENAERFLLGLAAFLVGHIGYLVCFAVLPGPLSWFAGFWVWGGMGVVALAFSVGNGVLPGAHRMGGWGLAVPVAAYMAVITAMTVAAWLTQDWWIALGATVFVASDSVLAINKFVRPLGWARPAIMVIYHVGQALIATGVLLEVR